MNIICYHHNDMDGRGAGYLVLSRFFKKDFKEAVGNFVEMDYNTPFDLEKCKGKKVFVVDIAFTRATIVKLLEICKVATKVIWIDHHQSSLDIIDDPEIKEELSKRRNLNYLVSNAGSGTLLTRLYLSSDIHKEYVQYSGFEIESVDYTSLMYFIKDGRKHSAHIPSWIKFIDDYDRWQKKIPQSEYFILGCQSENTGLFKNNDLNTFWLKLSADGVVLDYVAKGKTIMSYIKTKYNEELSEAFEYTIDGITFLCMNSRGNSYVFGDKIEDYPGVILYSYNGNIKKYDYSVYSRKNYGIDCKAFCEKYYGGGGHYHAAGFSTDKLIFDL